MHALQRLVGCGENPKSYFIHNILTRPGGSSVLFSPEEITSEYFRETLELKQTDAENHSEEDKDAISDIDDGYYSRK